MVVTSHDVARMADVSQATVSRALRDLPGVSASTRAKIRAAAKELGYVPIQTGRNLATRQTRRIGIVTDQLTNPFYPALIEPLHSSLRAERYRTVLLADGTDPSDLEPLLDGSLDGVVLTTCRLNSALPQDLARRGIPFVLVNREVNGLAADTCIPDNQAGAQGLADVLFEHGHRTIGVLAGPKDTSTSRDRVEGLRNQLARHGIALHPDHIVHTGFSVAEGERATAELLSSSITAVFAANDVLAIGALNVAVRHGIDVPSQLTITGFDDIALAGYATINLTTVRVDHQSLAEHSIRILLHRIEFPDSPPERRVMPTKVIRRRSHGPARATASVRTTPSG